MSVRIPVCELTSVSELCLSPSVFGPFGAVSTFWSSAFPSDHSSLPVAQIDGHLQAHPTLSVCPNFSQTCNYIIFCSGFPPKMTTWLGRCWHETTMSDCLNTWHGATLLCYRLIPVTSLYISCARMSNYLNGKSTNFKIITHAEIILHFFGALTET